MDNRWDESLLFVQFCVFPNSTLDSDVRRPQWVLVGVVSDWFRASWEDNTKKRDHKEGEEQFEGHVTNVTHMLKPWKGKDPYSELKTETVPPPPTYIEYVEVIW